MSKRDCSPSKSIRYASQCILLSACSLLSLYVTPVTADTLQDALSAAYANNPTLNAGRAQLRAVNENVPQARAGNRPTVQGNGSIGLQSQSSKVGGNSSSSDGSLGNVGVTIQQNLFDGFQTKNLVRSAEAGVLAGREVLRNTEQLVLSNTASSYVSVLRDRRVVSLREQDTSFLQEQVRAARSRLQVGEGTKTDVALAEAQLANASAALSAARGDARSSEAVYLQIVGKPPVNLKNPSLPAKLIPASLNDAIAISMKEHPSILAAQNNVEAGRYNVKAAEGTLLPSVTLNGSLDRRFAEDTDSETASVTANVSVPIYAGGARYSAVRQQKETLGQLQIQVDEARRQIRADVSSAWAILAASRAQITSAETNVRASRIAVSGLIEERNVGQKTTLDVLIAQSDLVDARVALENARRDRVAATYALLSAIGRLSGQKLNVASLSSVESPEVHYNSVKDRWFGLRATGDK